ncbi:RecQ family ATP-dependent DNA helicase [Enterococcus sp. LJL51]|uniref:RecQ family ATP-dependent DNA helicase n=1 Tax=Enterococcus sp. LJL51 TaxID=3416656 RepID=UPI003CF9CB4B
MDLKKRLFQHFGFTSFREGQEEVITALLSGQDTLAVLPTGTGKSLCYQYVGYVLEGTVLVVSPLLSLMEDQVRQLQSQGEGRVTVFNSTLSYEEKRYILEHFSEYNYVFISPESLVKEQVVKTLQRSRLALFVIDEAHCVSQWGVDFRPEYVKIKNVLENLDYPLTLALTATASDEVKKEIISELFNKNSSIKEVLHSVNRKNILMIVEKTVEKEQLVFDYLNKMNAKGIIYCSARKTTEYLSSEINRTGNFAAAFYHGGLTAAERSKIQQQFIDNELDVLCATNAFGMGIDKSDIRFVIHFDCPGSLESYVQEIGRAGRDGLPAAAVLLYQPGDEYIHQYFQGEVRTELQGLEMMLKNGKADSAAQQEQLSEIQQKWLAGYLEGSYSLEQLSERLHKKNNERYAQLQQMLAFIQTSDCRRKVILNYFSEKQEKETETWCCDNCGLEENWSTKLGITKNTVRLEANLSWQEILIRLFKDD